MMNPAKILDFARTQIRGMRPPIYEDVECGIHGQTGLYPFVNKYAVYWEEPIIRHATNSGLMVTDQFTPLEKISEIHETARRAFYADRARSIVFRKNQISQIGYLIKDNEDRLKHALKLDLGRPPLETELQFFDFGPVFKDVRLAYDNVEQRTKPQSIEFNLKYIAMSPKLKAEPKGVVLIISAFNLPLYLTLSPLLLAQLLPRYLDPELYHIVQGGVSEMSKILDLRWDHIIYIGMHGQLYLIYPIPTPPTRGLHVGRIVAVAAAKHLTPVTLELGGKNPVVVDPKVDVTMTAKRVLWGRFSNAGQVCTAPDFCTRGDHAARIQGLLDKTKGDIICGGQVNVEMRYVAPTIVNNVTAEDALMAEEIFGPVLLIVLVFDVDEAITYIRSREHPLAVYVFSPDKEFQDKVFSRTKSGAALANEVVIHPAVPGLPVGGIGASGYGYYAGKHAFEQFTHWRVSLDSPTWIDTVALGFRFPPYKDTYKKYIGLMYPPLPPRPRQARAKLPQKSLHLSTLQVLVSIVSLNV
ncbi:Aldehyde/histidinol dehydrogenase [Fomes fomentarius]|nr:Aldehyde/histidinol dehydrogenase [Fomes fomentarius]